MSYITEHRASVYKLSYVSLRFLSYGIAILYIDMPACRVPAVGSGTGQTLDAAEMLLRLRLEIVQIGCTQELASAGRKAVVEISQSQ